MAIDPNVTRSQYVDQMLTASIADLQSVQAAVRGKLGPKVREALSRQLAGVVSASESVRIWLASGAPR